VLKYYAFVKARQSFGFGRNPRLISGHMAQQQRQEAIQPNGPLVGEDQPPPLLFMGEQDNNVEKCPHGYFVKNTTGLVTINMVSQLNDQVVQSMQQLQDLCLSFSLFKLLRCRLARYMHANDRSVRTLNFF
jgi:hypothetical protein